MTPEDYWTYDDWEFWESIVCPNGEWDLDAVKRELHDYRNVLREVPKVYVHVTRGMISKPNTMAFEVLNVHDSHFVDRAWQECPYNCDRCHEEESWE